MYKPKDTAEFSADIEEPGDQGQLPSADRCRLASLMLRLGYGDDDVLPDLVDEHLRRLDSKIKTHASHALHQRKVDSAQKARLAAEAYLQGSGSMAQVCKVYGVTERTLSRNIARLRALAKV
jgi:hypothetical protein